MSRYFSIGTDPKLACSCCGLDSVDNGFLLLLDSIREEVGPLTIASGYRCPSHNKSVSSTGETGPHTTGRAVDISCRNGSLRRAIVKAGIKQGCRVGVAKTFVHVDNLSAVDGFPDNVMWVY